MTKWRGPTIYPEFVGVIITAIAGTLFAIISGAVATPFELLLAAPLILLFAGLVGALVLLYRVTA